MQPLTQPKIDVRQVIRAILALPDDKLASLYDVALQLGALDSVQAARNADIAKTETVLRYMETKGWITRPAHPAPITPFQPIRINGEPISEMIIRERR